MLDYKYKLGSYKLPNAGEIWRYYHCDIQSGVGIKDCGTVVYVSMIRRDSEKNDFVVDFIDKNMEDCCFVYKSLYLNEFLKKYEFVRNSEVKSLDDLFGNLMELK